MATLLLSSSRKPMLIKNTVPHLPCCTSRKTSKVCVYVCVYLQPNRERYCFYVHKARLLHLFCFMLQHWLLPYCQRTCHATRNEKTGHIRFASLAFSHARNRSKWKSGNRALMAHSTFSLALFALHSIKPFPPPSVRTESRVAQSRGLEQGII